MNLPFWYFEELTKGQIKNLEHLQMTHLIGQLSERIVSHLDGL